MPRPKKYHTKSELANANRLKKKLYYERYVLLYNLYSICLIFNGNTRHKERINTNRRKDAAKARKKDLKQ